MSNRMHKRKLRRWAFLLAVIACVLIAAVLWLQKNRPAVWQGGYPVHISEVMTSNISCPNEDGRLTDWVELQNTSDSDFALGGFYLSDDPEIGKFRFEAGTVVPANGYLVIWCDADSDMDGYAPFSLRREGGETVSLMNENQVVLDSALTVPSDSGMSLVRAEDGALMPTERPTPGFANTDEGFAAWSEILASRSGGALMLSEIMSSNVVCPAPDGGYYDFIEVYNPSDRPVSLAGYKLSDREADPKYPFPEDKMLGGGEYLVVWCFSGISDDPYFAPFALTRKGGETVTLTAPNGTAADSVTLPELAKNESYVRVGGEWAKQSFATPGYPNDEAGYAQYVLSGGYTDCGLYISEAAPKNKSLCRDSDGDFSDWIELGNAGPAPISLAGWFLSDMEELPSEWAFPDVTIEPGELLLVYASGKNKTVGREIHTSFSLSAGETITLSTPLGTSFASFTVPETIEDDESLVYEGSELWRVSSYPTPGAENSAEGYDALCENDTRGGALLIDEAAVSPSDGADWVRIRNATSAALDLSGWYLTDSLNEPECMALSGRIEGGQTLTFDCEGFALNAARDTLYLIYAGDTVSDWVNLHDIPAGGSCGRIEGKNGFWYFTAASRNAAQTAGYRRVTETPWTDCAPGAYAAGETLAVSLFGTGEIHYTTDGSTPTAESELYKEPIPVTETTILRAVAFESGALPGEALTLSYFIGEEHDLPIVSLVTDRGNLFGPTGIYSKHEQAWSEGWERPASVSLFEDGSESFTIDCGIRIHGRTSRRTSEKRSFTLKFRGSYDGALNYDVFGDGKITEFSSLLLRASVEDNYTSYMRDELFARIAMDYTEVPAQNYRYAALYINGEYWGLYAIREHHSPEYFAAHYGVDADTVDMQTGEFRKGADWTSLLTYAETNNLAADIAYNYIREHLDVEEMIDWLILECYSGDYDVYENVRFYASPDYNGGRYMYGLADMDLTMMSHMVYSVGFNMTGQLHGIIPVALLSNVEFRVAFMTRLSELLRGGLATENVNGIIDELHDTIESETARDLERWKKDPTIFENQVKNLHTFANGRIAEMVSEAQSYFGLSAEEMAQYFGDVK